MKGVIKLISRIPVFLYVILLSLVSSYIFYTILQNKWPDLYDHAVMYTKPWGPEIYSHVLYFLVLAIVTLNSNAPGAVYLATIIVLTGCVTWKFAVIAGFLRRHSLRRPTTGFAFLAFSLCFVHSIPFRVSEFYIGQFTGNVWHNSTTIMLVPLALLQFRYSLHLLNNYQSSTSYKLILVTVLANLVKPNFFLCYAAVFPLFLFYMNAYRLNGRFFLSLIHIFAGVLVLVFEYLVTYQGSDHSAGLLIAPFRVWDHYTGNKLLALVSSLLFPLLYVFLFLKRVLREMELLYAWLLYSCGLAIFILFCESGTRMYHGNFIWQMVPCTLVLFMVSLVSWSRHMFKWFHWKNLLCLSAFSLHVMAGPAYIVKIIKLGFW
jgi:hypothetical protein